MPNNSIFNPPTEENQSVGRNIPHSKPVSIVDAQPSPDTGQPSLEQTQGMFPVQTPLINEPTLNQLAQPPVTQESGNAPQQTLNEQEGQSNGESLPFNLPPRLEGDRYLPVTGTNRGFVDPSKNIELDTLYNQGQLDPATLAEHAKGVPYTVRDGLQDLTPDYEDQVSRVEQMRREANGAYQQYVTRREAFIREENYNRQANQSITSKIPTIDNDVSSRGLQSQLGKSLQDTFDPERNQNKVGAGGITDFLFKDVGNALNRLFKFTENLGDKEGLHSDNPILNLPLVSAGFVLNPLGNLQEKYSPKEYQKFQATTDKDWEGTMVRLSDKSQSDYGSAGLVSVGLRVLNTPWSMLNGLVYDVVDNTVMAAHNGGNDPHKGSRTLQALIDGRDWGIENQWSAEKYLGMSEPEDVRGKGYVWSNTNKELDPNDIIPDSWQNVSRTWWNAPENVASTLSMGNKKVEQAIERPAHWLIQGVPTYTISFFGSGGLDNLVGKGTALISKGVTNTVRVIPEMAKLTQVVKLSAKIDEMVRNTDVEGILDASKALPDAPVAKVPSSVFEENASSINNLKNTVVVDNPDGVQKLVIPYVSESVTPKNLIKVEDYVTSTYKPGLIDSPTLSSSRIVENVERNSDDILSIGKRKLNTLDDVPSLTIIDPRRATPLSDSEVGALRQIDSVELSQYGTAYNKKLDNAVTLVTDDGRMLDVPTFPKAVNTNESYDDILGVNSDNALEVFNKAEQTLKNADSTEQALETATSQRVVAVAKLADNGEAYQVVKGRLPGYLQSDGNVANEAGNMMIGREVQLAGESAEAKRLDMTIRDLQKKTTLLGQKLDMYPYYRKNLVAEQANMEFFGDEPNPRLSMSGEVPLVPEPRLPKPEFTDYGNTYYHGGTKERSIQSIDVNAAKTYSDNYKGTGFYLTQDENAAKEFGEAVSKFSLDESKILKVGSDLEFREYLIDNGAGGLENDEIGTFMRSKGYTGVSTPDETVIYDKSALGYKLVNGVPEQRQQSKRLTSRPGVYYHGGKDLFSIEDIDTTAGRDYDLYGKGFYLTEDPNNAAEYGGKISQYSVDKSRLFVTEDEISFTYWKRDKFGRIDDSNEIPKKMMELGYTGIEVTNPKGDIRQLIIFDKSVLHPVDTLEHINDAGLTVVKDAMEYDNQHLIATIPKNWKHGTTMTGDLRRIDPLQGASSSEFGKGIYLTTSDDVAKAASLKGHLSNKPFDATVGTDFSKPRINTVDVSGLRNVIDGSSVVPAKYKNMFYVAAGDALKDFNLTGGGIKLKSNLTFSELFNQFPVIYKNKYGEAPTEMIVDRFQQNLTKRLIDDGIEGMYLNRNGVETLAVYQPHQLRNMEVIPISRTGTVGETLEAKRYLELQTYKQLRDEVSGANAAKAQKDFTDYQLQRAIEARTAKEHNMSVLMNDINELENELLDSTTDTQRGIVRYSTDRLPTEIKEKYSEPFNRIFNSPC